MPATIRAPLDGVVPYHKEPIIAPYRLAREAKDERPLLITEFAAPQELLGGIEVQQVAFRSARLTHEGRGPLKVQTVPRLLELAVDHLGRGVR